MTREWKRGFVQFQGLVNGALFVATLWTVITDGPTLPAREATDATGAILFLLALCAANYIALGMALRGEDEE